MEIAIHYSVSVISFLYLLQELLELFKSLEKEQSEKYDSLTRNSKYMMYLYKGDAH